MYGCGPPRVKVTLQLGPQPRTVAECDVPGSTDKPTTLELPVRFTTESRHAAMRLTETMKMGAVGYHDGWLVPGARPHCTGADEARRKVWPDGPTTTRLSPPPPTGST